MPQKKKEKGAHQIQTSDIWRRTQKGNSPRTVTHDAQPGNRARTPAGKLRTEGLKARLTNGFWPPVRKILGRLLKLKKGVL